MSAPITRRLLRADGSFSDLPHPISMSTLAKLIGANALATVMMRHMGSPLHVMLVDDAGYETSTKTTVLEGGAIHLEIVPVKARRPVNVEATRLYRMNCHPGTKHEIVGDVVIVPDEDFGDDGPASNLEPPAISRVDMAVGTLAVANTLHLPRQDPIWEHCILELTALGQCFHIRGTRPHEIIYVCAKSDEAPGLERGHSAFMQQAELVILTGRRSFRVAKHRHEAYHAGHIAELDTLPEYVERYRALYWPTPEASEAGV